MREAYLCPGKNQARDAFALVPIAAPPEKNKPGLRPVCVRLIFC